MIFDFLKKLLVEKKNEEYEQLQLGDMIEINGKKYVVITSNNYYTTLMMLHKQIKYKKEKYRCYLKDCDDCSWYADICNIEHIKNNNFTKFNKLSQDSINTLAKKYLEKSIICHTFLKKVLFCLST